MRRKYGEKTCCICGHSSERGKAEVTHPDTKERVHVCMNEYRKRNDSIQNCRKELGIE